MSARADRYGLPLIIVIALCAMSMAQTARTRQMNPAVQNKLSGWPADVNGDGKSDTCQLVIQSGFSGIKCTIAGSGQAIQSPNLDLGYPEGRAFVDFDGDRKADYCRVIDDKRSSVACTLAEGNFVTTLQSEPLELGYPDTRQWRDVNGDGKADFCRVVGTYRDTMACTFSQGRARPYFGRTVNSKR
jgi:hypothetical protein